MQTVEHLEGTMTDTEAGHSSEVIFLYASREPGVGLERSSQTLGSPFTPFSLTSVFEWLQVAKVIEASIIFDYRLNGLMQRLKHWELTLLK